MSEINETAYSKVAKLLKITGGEDYNYVSVSRFKGISECAERLEQLKAVFDSGTLSYKEDNGFFTITVSGDCDISCPFGACYCASDICDNLDGAVTQEEAEVFFNALPEKNDVWGWLYRATVSDQCFCWGDIFASLISPDFKQSVQLSLSAPWNETEEIELSKES